MSNKDVKIFVGMPSSQQIPVLTCRSLMEWQHKRRYPSMFEFKLDTYIDKARNEIVWQAAKEGATHLMFIDSDMVFPSGGVDYLVEQKKDIIGALYFGRMHPKAQAFHLLEGNKIVNVDPKKESGTFEVDFVGTGFMLINMDVFKKMMPPFFRFDYKESGLEMQGEDMFFCKKAKDLGFKIWCDTTMRIGHVGFHTYFREDYDAYINEPTLYGP